MRFVQPGQEVQDDLASLLSRNLRLDPEANPPPPEEPKIVYISQHYHHSRHVVPAQQQQYQEQEQERQILNSPRPSSEPPQPEYAAAEKVLRDNGIDSSALSAPQLQLFKEGDTPQQLRLIQLWQICPPRNSTDNPTLTWSNTSVEQEEILAKMRYEQQQAEQQRREQEQVVEATMSLDGTPLTPIQAGDGRWIQTIQPHTYMEPYMASGYEELARREYEESVRRAFEEEAMQRSKETYQPLGSAVGAPTYKPATDPVYQTTNMGLHFQEQQQMMMEDQYGRMMQFRNGCHDEEML
ncbi:hypothetical protein GQ53DRAFT_648089 [Thozetella sp. PMI_491]|nr:hypothetical protein GQ53DRAFT_648089 [Thozetella sp. PMI_491]